MGKAATEFELIVIVDWSAAATKAPEKPSPDRCWIAWQNSTAPPEAEYFRSRRHCKDRLAALIAECKGSAFFGFDFPFGYPAGAGLGGGRSAAARLDALVSDPDGTANNRFDVASDLNEAISATQGPFWGHPTGRAYASLQPTKPNFAAFDFSEDRVVEALLRRRGKQIMTLWQLMGVGAVGSQTLTGLPVLHQLCREISPRPVRYWPFETGWNEHLDGLIFGEVWPSLLDFNHIDHDIKDARQVIALCADLWRKNLSGCLVDDFTKPERLTAEQAAQVTGEEGWILGVC